MSNSISRQFWRYTIPTVAAMLVNGLYQVVDGIFIGRYVGADGLAGINVAWPVIGSILGIGMLVGVGTGALVSIRQGEKDAQGAKQILATGLTLLLAITPIVSALKSGIVRAWNKRCKRSVPVSSPELTPNRYPSSLNEIGRASCRERCW